MKDRGPKTADDGAVETDAADSVRKWRLFGVTARAYEWIALGLCVVLALGFATQMDVEFAKSSIQRGGYWFMWGLVGGALWFAQRVVRQHADVLCRWWRSAPRRARWAPMVLIAAGSLFTHLHVAHRFKVLMDEITLVNTSQALHQHRKVFTPGNAEYRNGVFLVHEGFIDKRPCLYPFLVSLVHDLTGYRVRNGIWLNAALTPVVVSLFFVLGRRMRRRYGGAVAVVLAAGVPIFAHTFTGGGFEPLNMLLLLALVLAGMLCVEKPDSDRVSLVVMTACLLAYTRYESGLYVLAAGGILWIAFRKMQALRFPAAVFLAPFICVPLVWLQLVAFSDEAGYFQLAAKNDASAFSPAFLPENLQSAVDYFLVPSKVNLSSPLIAVVGVVALSLLLFASIRGAKNRSNQGFRPPIQALVLVSLATIANAGIFLFFNYGQYASYITQRISVPVWAVLILAVVWATGRWRAIWVARGGLVLGVANLFVFHLPAANGDLYRREYLEGKNCDFVLDTAQDLASEEGILVYSFSPSPWLAVQRQAIGFRFAPKDLTDVAALVRSGQYHRVLVHVMEYEDGVDLPVGERHQPPTWFAAAPKRLIKERWVYSRILDRIYEIEIPVRLGSAK